MQIAHEAPLSIMKEVRTMTDYDYALVHLFEDKEIGFEYYEFFRRSLMMGRTVILDNSIFELGEAFDTRKFVDWIIQLQPTEYIVPDVLEDSMGTRENIEKWFNSSNYVNPSPGYYLYSAKVKSKSIGVVQGKTYEELVECYKTVEQYCDKIAISFDYSWYEKVCPHSNKLYSWMYGRRYLIDLLLENEVINKNKPHHLLGCGLPQEFTSYKCKRYSFIESMDSSNPVVHGCLKIPYEGYGLDRKSSQKLHTMITSEVDDEQFNIICKNIYKFRKFAR